MKKFYSLLLLLTASLTLGCSDGDDKVITPDEPEIKIPTVEIQLGEITNKSAEVIISSQDAIVVSYLCQPYEMATPSTAEIVSKGIAYAPTGESETILIEGLDFSTTYCVYVVGENEGVFSDTASEKFKTLNPSLPDVKALSCVETTNKGFTYAVNVSENESYLHTYIEGWYFDYMLAMQLEQQGTEFDINLFIQQMLVDWGFLDMGSKEHKWTAGDINEYRSPYIATIIGSQKYYALFSRSTSDGTSLVGEPEALAMTTKECGDSDASINVIIEDLQPKYMRARMECPENVRFFFYNLWTLSSVEPIREEYGEEGMKSIVYEYGYVAANTYTDAWEAAAETEYVLALMGADLEGNLFYQEQLITTPELLPSIAVDMRTYEREAQGYHAYDTFEITTTPRDFKNPINGSDIRYILLSEQELTSALEALGQTIESFVSEPTAELISSLGDKVTSLTDEEVKMFTERGTIVSIYTGMQPETTYCYLPLIPFGDGTYRTTVARATTEKAYVEEESSEAYKAYLGEWELKGVSSEDYYTRQSITLRFEEYVPNRTYKIYGWSMGDISQQFPFEARFDTQTETIFIDGGQILGQIEKDGVQHDVMVIPLISYYGELGPFYSYTKNVYELRINGAHLSAFPAIISYGGYQQEVSGLSYYSCLNDELYYIDGEQYPIVNFTIDRPAN